MIRYLQRVTYWATESADYENVSHISADVGKNLKIPKVFGKYLSRKDCMNWNFFLI